MAPMSAISVHQLTKSYRVYRKREGLLAAVRGLFHREYKTVEAVRGVSFEIDTGEMVAFLGPNGAGAIPRPARRPCWGTSPGSGRTPTAGGSPW